LHNKKRRRFIVYPLRHKKERNERKPADNQIIGVRPFISHYTKLAGKLFFPTYCNYLIFNNIIFELNRCMYETFKHFGI
jgi:hypothetical protein